MRGSPPASRQDDVERGTPAIASSIESIILMKGQRELIIRHGTQTYRLRVTASNKLILTK